MEQAEISWLDHVEAQNVTGFVQYLHAFQWVLTPPSPPVVSADSVLERIYCIFIVGRLFSGSQGVEVTRL